MRLGYLIICWMFLSPFGNSQGIEFFHGDWKDALAKAESEGKMLFVDAYTTWCGPCKKMASVVFPDPKVGAFFNEQFINIKIDMEEEQGRSFGSKYSVSAYPTIMFIDGASGDMIHRNVGFVPAEKIILNAKMAIKKNDKSEEYAKKYEAGERDFDLVMNYVKALNTAEHNSLKISNEYLRTNPDLSPEQKARFLFEATTEADSRIFDMLLQSKSQLQKIMSDDEIYSKIKAACDKTVDKSIEYEMVDLLEEAQDKMKSFFPKQEKVFKITSEMCYYEGMAELDKYAEKTEQYYKKFIKNDSEQLDRLSAKLAKKYKSNAEILDLAEKLSERAVKIDKTIPHLSNLASILFQNNKREKAFEVVDEAIEIAREAGEPVRNLEGMKRYFNSK